MVTRILIARHGNTFHKNQIPTRVGRHTDLPLIEETLARNLGQYIKAKGLIPKIVWAAPLQRTLKTAQLAIEEMQTQINLQQSEQFSEIDYGPDENKTEADVELRLGKIQALKNASTLEHYTTQELQTLGKQSITAWNKQAIVPNGWKVDPKNMIKIWIDFAKKIENDYQNQTVMVVSSNGIIRFAPYITQNFDEFSATHNIKVATGNLCIFEKSSSTKNWNCIVWDLNPTQQLIYQQAY